MYANVLCDDATVLTRLYAWTICGTVTIGLPKWLAHSCPSLHVRRVISLRTCCVYERALRCVDAVVRLDICDTISVGLLM